MRPRSADSAAAARDTPYSGARSAFSTTDERDWASPSGARLALVQRARDGDRAAFEGLVLPRLEPTFRFAMAVLGNEADARDATQDAMLSAWRGIRSLRDADRFDAWLGRIQVNACRAIGRRRRRAKVREIPMAEIIAADDRPSPAAPLDEEVAQLDQLERAFERLPVPQRVLLTLHHLEHRSIAEIAAVLGAPEGTVKWRLHAARQALASSLAEAQR